MSVLFVKITSDSIADDNTGQSASVASTPERSTSVQPPHAGNPATSSSVKSTRLPLSPRSPSPNMDPRKPANNSLRAKTAKLLRPVPVVSPSVFRPYLRHKPPSNMSQDPIEEFSSPERDRRKPTMPARPVMSKLQKLPLHTRAATNRGGDKDSPDSEGRSSFSPCSPAC